MSRCVVLPICAVTRHGHTVTVSQHHAVPVAGQHSTLTVTPPMHLNNCAMCHARNCDALTLAPWCTCLCAAIHVMCQLSLSSLPLELCGAFGPSHGIIQLFRCLHCAADMERVPYESGWRPRMVLIEGEGERETEEEGEETDIKAKPKNRYDQRCTNK